MSTFPLKIVTPDGMIFDGEAERLIVRTTEGDLTVLARHMNFVAALDTGRATVVDASSQRRHATCHGGLLSVMDGKVTVISSGFVWNNPATR